MYRTVCLSGRYAAVFQNCSCFMERVAQWRREGFRRPGQRSVVPPLTRFQGYGIFEVEYLMDKVIAHYSEVIFVIDLQC